MPITDIRESQVNLYTSDWSWAVRDLLDGTIELCAIASGWLEANVPHLLDRFRFLDLTNQSFQGERYPFLTSTPLYPHFALAAATHVPWRVQRAVIDALLALDRPNITHPAQIARFTAPGQYEAARRNAQLLGVLVYPPPPSTGPPFCLNKFMQTYDLLTCPTGYVKRDRASVLNGCAAANLSCPPGPTCICQPCAPVVDIRMQSVRLPLRSLL